MKQAFERFIPAPASRLGSVPYHCWHNHGRQLWARTINHRWARNHHALIKYQDWYQGQRCFIIGDDPSLRQTDLSLLNNEITFGLNRFYLSRERVCF